MDRSESDALAREPQDVQHLLVRHLRRDNRSVEPTLPHGVQDLLGLVFVDGQSCTPAPLG